MSFTEINNQLRALENEGEQILSQYSAIVQNAQESSIPQDLAANIESRAELIDDLLRAASEPSAPSTATAQAQRHREILEDHKSTASRLQEERNSYLSRHNLLSNVRSDIANHQSGAENEDQYYLGESGRIEHSNSLADRLLEQAYETRQDFMQQQATLRSVQRRIWHTMSTIPGINTIVSKINTRQKRNSLILATVLALCVLFVIFVR